MCALAHYIEEEGVATTTIALVRDHAERVAAPRALWVPFELGRPLGPPSDAAFQRRVLLAALDLLVTAEWPGTIVDFPEEDPRARPDPAWSPPFPPHAEARGDAGAIAAGMAEEIQRLAPAHAAALQKWGRTTIGLAGLTIAEAGAFIVAFLDAPPRTSPARGLSVPLALRFAADDLKAYYLEAATGGPGTPSSRQLLDWFWDGTSAGRALFAIRAAALAGTDEALKAIAGRLLVPVTRLHPPGRGAP